METISAFEAKTRFGSILDRVAAGEEIVITRHDKAIARIIPEGAASLESIREAALGLRALRAKIAGRKGYRPVTAAEIKSAINEGRR
jgi:prevent-host-death family protein